MFLNLKGGPMSIPCIFPAGKPAAVITLISILSLGLAAAGPVCAHEPDSHAERGEPHSHAEGDEQPSHAEGEGHSHSHGEELHFTHPLIAESPSPDTKIRFDVFSFDLDGEEESGSETELRVEAEYAFFPSFSVELGVPWVSVDPDGEAGVSNLGNVGLGFKFANFAFADKGLLLGYGLELGLPTGDDDKGIGSSNILEIEPFLSLRYKQGRFELVSFLEFGIPTNQDEEKEQEVETELGVNLSLLYHASHRVQVLLEIDGERVLSGEEEGEESWNLTPGVKLRPVARSSLLLGVGVGFPISGEEEFDTRLVGSVFYHF